MHESVLLQGAVEALAIKPAGVYVDGTFGRGGHSRVILSQLSLQGQLIVFDKDDAAIAVAMQLQAEDQRVQVVKASFAQMKHVLKNQGLLGKVDGILLDLGVSSPQLDEAERGFSFLRDGPLDMRMDQGQPLTAALWLNAAEQHEISRVLKVYGEEKFANLIAKHIVLARQKRPFETTVQLANLIAEVVPDKAQQKGKHPATRSFQALRIFINKELEDLETLLADVVEMLSDDGRLAVISFHSLEDRIVKQFIREQETGPVLPRYIPVTQVKRPAHLKSVSKAQKADDDEVSRNVRSRSAVMRVAQKVAACN